MPASVVKTPEEEVDWNRAKDIVSKQYPNKETEDKDGYFALVMTVYKSIRKGHGDTHFDEEKMWENLERILHEAPTALREWIVSGQYLAVGDEVSVLTLLGKPVSSGIVKSISESEIVLSVPRGAEFTTTGYDRKAFGFLVKLYTEEAATKIWLRESVVAAKQVDTTQAVEGRARRAAASRESSESTEEHSDESQHPFDIPTEIAHDEAPAKQYTIIMKNVPGLDLRGAAVLWKDITQLGFPEAMKLHSVESPELLKSDLQRNNLIGK